MRSLFGAAVVLVFATVGFGEELPMKWHAEYGKALTETKSNEQPLLVVLDNAQAPFQQIAASVENKEQAELLKKYTLCHVDVNSDYGQKVAKAFKATSFPHTVVIDKTGSIQLVKKTGEIESADWTSLLKNYQSGDRSVVPASNKMESFQYKSGTSYCPSCQRR